MVKRKGLAIILALAMVISLLPSGFTAKKVDAASYDAETAGRRVVGYLPSYRTYAVDSIDFSAMTHCNLSFMTYAGGTLTSGFSAYDVQNIVSRCHANNCKAIIAIGGWDGFHNDGVLTTASRRTDLVNQIMNYVNTYSLDGVDIDFEVNDADVWANFEAFISELSGRLKSQGKILTMAVATWFTDPISSGTWKYFDFLNLMAYDANSNGSGDHAPMSLVNNMISYFNNRGVSNDRLVIGVPFYGYGPSGAVTFAEMVQKNAAYAYQDYAEGVYYNGINTIKSKAEFSKSYGGTMIWEVAQDSFGTYSLLKVIKDVMAAGGSTQQPTQAPEQPTSQYVATKDWNAIEFLVDGAGGGAYANQFKFYCSDSRVGAVNIQNPGFTDKPSVYVTFPSGVSACSLPAGSYDIQGAGVALHVDAFSNTETEFTATDAMGTYTCYIYNARPGSTGVEVTTQNQQQTEPSSDGKYEKYDPNKEYIGGSYVEYEGNIYEAQWWTKGETPGASGSGVWRLVGPSGEETTTQEQTTTQRVFDAYSRIEAEDYDEQSGIVIDNNDSVSGGKNIGGVTDGDYIRFNKVKFSENAGAVTVQYASKSGDALGNIEVYVDSLSNKVATLEAANTDSTWNNYVSLTGKLDSEITAGEHAVYLKFVTTGSAAYVANVDYFTFVKASEYKEPEKPADTNVKVEINGCQISTTVEGFRVVYSVGDVDGEVVDRGLVYGLTDKTDDSEMVVGSSNENVFDYAATSAGFLEGATFSDLQSASSYAMTMKFIKTAEFYGAKISVRAYAKLADGTYVYSDVKHFTVYDVASVLYNGHKMNTFNSHNYLYENILKVVNPSYEEVDFDWTSSVVKPGDI